MEEIEKRLRESTDACIKSFEDWVKANKSLEARENLMETMHEVRKVISRVEIEIAVSERDRLGSRPIPIPAHRSQRKRPGEPDSEGSEYNTDDFEDSNDAQPGQGGHEQPRRQQQGGGRHRRPMQNRSGGGGNHGGGNNGNTSGGGDSQPQ